MKRFVARTVFIMFMFVFSLTALGKVPQEILDRLNKDNVAGLYVQIMLAKAYVAQGSDESVYSDALDTDLTQFTIEELGEIKDRLDAILNGELDDQEEHIDITVYDKPFTSEQNAEFQVYMAVADAGRQFEYVVQNSNPEFEYDDDINDVSLLRIYLTYYKNCTKEEAKDVVEDYADELLYVIPNTFPKVNFKKVMINWCISSLTENDLYSAVFWCEQNDGELYVKDTWGRVFK